MTTAPAPAQPMPIGVEGNPRDENQIVLRRPDRRPRLRGLGHTVAPGPQVFPTLDRPEDQPALALHGRKQRAAAALERRFQSVNVEPPTPDETVAILKGLRDRYEAHHRVSFTDGALESAVELSTRYINNRFLPDKAIDVMDEAGARVRLKNMVAPPDLRQLSTEIEELDRAKEEAVHSQEFEKAAKLRDQAYQLRKKKEQVQND